MRLPLTMRYRPAEPPPEELWRGGTMRDLGAGGVRFTATQRLEKGTLLDIDLTLPTRTAPYLFTGSVVWTVPTKGGQYEYGVAFVNVTPERQFEIDQVVQFLTSARAKT